MSKSRPESIVDPLTVIPKYGTDALRMALVMGVSPGNDQNWSKSKIEANRNFANKLWNIARYVEGTLGNEVVQDGKPEPKTAADHWVLERINQEGKRIADHLDNYRFSEAYDTLYHLIWDDVADWYIEASKSALNASVLNYSLGAILKLAHPFAPFVTETIWQSLHPDTEVLLARSAWPKQVHTDSKKAAQFSKIKSIVSEIRTIKTMLHIKGLSLYFKQAHFIEENAQIIKELAKLADVKQVSDGRGLRLTQTSEEAWLDIDLESARDFIGRLKERRESITKQVGLLEGRLSNEAYVKKAPKQLVDETKQQLKDLQTESKTIDTQLEQFKSL